MPAATSASAAKAARGPARTPKVRLFAGPNDNGVAGSVDDRKVATQKIFGIFVRLALPPLLEIVLTRFPYS